MQLLRTLPCERYGEGASPVMGILRAQHLVHLGAKKKLKAT